MGGPSRSGQFGALVPAVDPYIGQGLADVGQSFGQAVERREAKKEKEKTEAERREKETAAKEYQAAELSLSFVQHLPDEDPQKQAALRRLQQAASRYFGTDVAVPKRKVQRQVGTRPAQAQTGPGAFAGDVVQGVEPQYEEQEILTLGGQGQQNIAQLPAQDVLRQMNITPNETQGQWLAAWQQRLGRPLTWAEFSDLVKQPAFARLWPQLQQAAGPNIEALQAIHNRTIEHYNNILKAFQNGQATPQDVWLAAQQANQSAAQLRARAINAGMSQEEAQALFRDIRQDEVVGGIRAGRVPDKQTEQADLVQRAADVLAEGRRTGKVDQAALNALRQEAERRGYKWNLILAAARKEEREATAAEADITAAQARAYEIEQARRYDRGQMTPQERDAYERRNQIGRHSPSAIAAAAARNAQGRLTQEQYQYLLTWRQALQQADNDIDAHRRLLITDPTLIRDEERNKLWQAEMLRLQQKRDALWNDAQIRQIIPSLPGAGGTTTPATGGNAEQDKLIEADVAAAAQRGIPWEQVRAYLVNQKVPNPDRFKAVWEKNRKQQAQQPAPPAPANTPSYPGAPHPGTPPQSGRNF